MLKYRSTSVLYCLLFLFACAGNAMGQIRITGSVINKNTLEPVPHCHILIMEQDHERVLVGGRDGTFKYTSRSASTVLKIQVSSLGFAPHTNHFFVHGDTLLTISLKPDAIHIPEVTVHGTLSTSQGTNAHIITPKDAGLSISVLGEVDVIKPIQNLPGISRGIDGSMSLFVRGGNNGNNRIELDGVPIYGSTHLFGLTSIFQAELVRDVIFKMGGISARNGNFLSSVTQVNTDDPIRVEKEYSASLSPLILGAHASLPLKSSSMGLSLGGRYSLLKPEIDLFSKLSGNSLGFTPQVADGLAKFVWQINNANVFSTSVFASNDYYHIEFPFEDQFDEGKKGFFAQNWRNTIFNMIWDYKPGLTTTIKTTAYINQFSNSQEIRNYKNDRIENGRLLRSAIQDYTIGSVMNKSFQSFDIELGYQWQYMLFSPASQKQLSANDIVHSENEFDSNLASLFLSVHQQLNQRLNYQAGIRGYYYQSRDYHKVSADIRLSADYRLFTNFGFNASYDQFTQFYHTLEGLPMGWSLDLIVPAYNEFVPSRAHQWYQGVFWQFQDYHLNVGAYYKAITGIVGYSTVRNIIFPNNISWYNDLDTGKGKSYGLEFMLNRKTDRWSYSISYTLSRSTREYQIINRGEPFPFKFDRPHILNLQNEFVTYVKNNRYQSVFTTLSITSGHKTTLGIAQYPGEPLPYWYQRDVSNIISPAANNWVFHPQHMSEKNDYTMPAYFRVDLGYTFKRVRSNYTREFTITCFNITNHQNPYLYYMKDSKWYQISLFPILPSFRYKIVF